MSITVRVGNNRMNIPSVHIYFSNPLRGFFSRSNNSCALLSVAFGTTAFHNENEKRNRLWNVPTGAVSIADKYRDYFMVGNNGSINANTYFWASSANNASNAWYRVLNSSNNGVNRTNNNKTNGFSVRCKK